ncbi:MAG: hypothetical protein B7X90_04895 [Novosphingobium sp. 17-62-19]|nr:MAG: hypothetical protein B7X90_04895 [Novosphingobium sp. 17-62-19]
MDIDLLMQATSIETLILDHARGSIIDGKAMRFAKLSEGFSLPEPVLFLVMRPRLDDRDDNPRIEDTAEEDMLGRARDARVPEVDFLRGAAKQGEETMPQVARLGLCIVDFEARLPAWNAVLIVSFVCGKNASAVTLKDDRFVASKCDRRVVEISATNYSQL